MKRRTSETVLNEFISRRRLSRADLEVVVDILRSANFEVVIQDGEFVFDDLDDLAAERGVAPRTFEIEGSIPDTREVAASAYSQRVIFNYVYGSVSLRAFGKGVSATFHQIANFVRSRPGWIFPLGLAPLQRRHEAFLNRNADKLLLIVMGALAGQLVPMIFRLIGDLVAPSK